MKDRNIIQLSQIIDTARPRAVLHEIRKIFYFHYPHKPYREIIRSFKSIKSLFEGKYPGYRACNTEYHNLTHTLDATLATARLIDGFNLKGNRLSLPLALNLLHAALFHDTGYIQEVWDSGGTGAKFTQNHVERSTAFLVKQSRVFEIDPSNVSVISRIIKCTGLTVNLDNIPFADMEERVAGCILGTADLLGQMSDRQYMEKLLFLYSEFREAGIPGYETEFDIIRKTLGFYEMITRRFDDSYMKVAEYARYHFLERYSCDHNLYMEAIDRHISYIKEIIRDETTNFRHKLKRADWVKKTG